MQKKGRNTGTIQSIDRALDILCCFSISTPELGISELAFKLSMYKSTIYRILKTLEERGFVIQNLENQKYRLGFKLFDLGIAVISELEVRNIALPLMQELNDKTKETVTLNIVDDDYRVCIEKVESKEAIRNFEQLGGRNPLHLAGSGKLLLAYLPEKEIERIITKRDLGLTALGKRILADKLREELALIRQQGYAFTNSERNIGSCSVSAPIRNHEGNVMAGISISGPESRFAFERLVNLIAETVSTANLISYQLGWR